MAMLNSQMVITHVLLIWGMTHEKPRWIDMPLGETFQVHKAFHVRSGEIVAIKKAKETVADRDVGGTVTWRSTPFFGLVGGPNPCIIIGGNLPSNILRLVPPVFVSCLNKNPGLTFQNHKKSVIGDGCW